MCLLLAPYKHNTNYYKLPLEVIFTNFFSNGFSFTKYLIHVRSQSRSPFRMSQSPIKWGLIVQSVQSVWQVQLVSRFNLLDILCSLIYN